MNLQRAHVQRERLASFRAEYHVSELTDGRGTVEVGAMRNLNAFMRQLDTALAAAEQQIAGARSDVQRQQAVWKQARARAQAVEKLVERIARAERLQAERRAERALDELASRPDSAE